MKQLLTTATMTALAGTLSVTMPQVADAVSSPFGVDMKMIEIDGLDIAYREAGNPENPTVLLLHGFPTSSHMFRELMPVLA